MKICFYCDSIFTFGGVQRVLAVLAKELSKKHEISILTLDDPSLKDTTMYGLSDANIKYTFLKYPESPMYEFIPSKIYSFLYKNILPQNRLFSKWYGYSSFPKSKRSHLINTLKRGDYDIVIGVHVFMSYHLAVITKEISSKTIGWMHSSYDAFFTIENPYVGILKNFFIHVLPNLDKLIVLSKSDQTRYSRDLNIKSSVIYNPLTINNNEEAEIKSKTFLAVGRLSRKAKGFDILIKAFALFANENKEWDLKIVGEGTEKEYLQSLINEEELEARVEIFPFTKHIEPYYNRASVFILSSRWEGFGLVLIEAMSYGLPIIASDLPITRELLDGKNVALFFESENVIDLSIKMTEIAQMDSLSFKKMSDNALGCSDHFSIHKIAIQWESVFNDLKIKTSNNL
jgi:glycosyltransferase involved in cell wall biosynthesis